MIQLLILIDGFVRDELIIRIRLSILTRMTANSDLPIGTVLLDKNYFQVMSYLSHSGLSS